MMRVLFDLRPLQSPSGARGIGTYIRELVSRLHSQVDFSFLLWKGRPLPLESGITCSHVLMPAPPHWTSGWLWDRIYWLFNRLPAVDLVHYPSALELDLGWPSWRPQCPTVVTVHDLLPVTHPEASLPGRYRVLRPIYAHLARQLASATGLLAVSEFTARQTQHYLGRCPPIQTTPLGVSKAFRPGPTPNDLNLPPRFWLYVGALDHRKNLELLLKVLAAQTEPLPLVVASGAASPPDRRRLLRLAEGLEVRWLAHLPRTQLVELYRSAEALVFPSWGEGFGLPVLEAMACGTPVACSRIGAFCEVAGDSAVYFEPDDPLSLERALVKVSAERAKLGQLGLERARRFDWDHTAQLTLDHYVSLVRP